MRSETIEPTLEDAEPAPEAAAPWGEVLSSVMRQAAEEGGGDLSLLRTLVSRANLTPQQEAMVELFFSLQGEGPLLDQLDGGPGDDESFALAEEPLDPDALPADLESELSDLREVNDTLAAALGACPMCWGGDAACACEGLGQVGSSDPDPRLFDELIVPAVRRVSELRRADRRAPSRKRRRAAAADPGRAKA